MAKLRITIVTIAIVLLGKFAYAAGDAAAGKVTYDAKCKSCHGANGEGNEKIATMLKVTLANLGSPEVQAASDNTIRQQILEGDGKMKPVKGLSDKDIQNVVAHLRTMKQK